MTEAGSRNEVRELPMDFNRWCVARDAQKEILSGTHTQHTITARQRAREGRQHSPVGGEDDAQRRARRQHSNTGRQSRQSTTALRAYNDTAYSGSNESGCGVVS